MLPTLLLLAPATEDEASAPKRGGPTSGAHSQPTNGSKRGAVREMRPISWFSWDALNVTSATQCGWHKCYFPSQREDEGWLVGQLSKCLRPSSVEMPRGNYSHQIKFQAWLLQRVGFLRIAELGRLPRSCERALGWII